MFPKRTCTICFSEGEEKRIELSDLAEFGSDAAATCHAAKARRVLWVRFLCQDPPRNSLGLNVILIVVRIN